MGQCGYVVLILAFVFSIIASINFLLNARKKEKTAASKILVYIICGLLTVSVLIMETALVSHNFSLSYVIDYSSRSMSFPYLVSSLWAGNAGSLLFWAWVLSICGAVVMWRWKERAKQLISVTGSITMAVLAFFLLLLVAKENPFIVQSSVPADGIGLNPLLQNPAMIIHPPMLLAG